MDIKTLRHLQYEYGEQKCPDCEDGFLTLYYDGDAERLIACCSCGFQEEQEKEEQSLSCFI